MAVNLGRRFWLLTLLFLFFNFSAFHQTRSEIVTITSNTFADKETKNNRKGDKITITTVIRQQKEVVTIRTSNSSLSI